MPDSELLSNRYHIIRALGTGGFGQTFLVEDTYLPSRRLCVVKQLRAVAETPRGYQVLLERFQREAAVLEELGEACRQIPRLYAHFGENDQFYLVQEWVDGDTLTQMVAREGAWSEARVMAFLTSLLPVLDLVHRKRIIHRDIKPDNVIIRRSDQLPVLIDFGAVKESVNSTLVGSQSMVIGTPGFMPSDQAVGRPVFSSDLYALSLTAVFLLTGKWPDELPINQATGQYRWQVPGLSPRLVGVLNKAMEFNPRDRFSTARDMLEVLAPGRVPELLVTIPLPSSPTLPETVGILDNPSGSPKASSSASPASPTSSQKRSFSSQPVTAATRQLRMPASGQKMDARLIGWMVITALGFLSISLTMGYLLWGSNREPLPLPTTSPTSPATFVPLPTATSPSPLPSPPLTPTPTPLPSPLLTPTPTQIPLPVLLTPPPPPPRPLIPPPPPAPPPPGSPLRIRPLPPPP
ncbi:MAG: serine/threonine-protein kinase [Cyanobacteriota bacterium]|nr:serine/threonine-protein kinase [Cyanobacteriota bacterium]